MKRTLMTVTVAAAALTLTACQERGAQEQGGMEGQQQEQAQAGEQQEFGETGQQQQEFGQAGQQEQAQAGQQQEQELLLRSEAQQVQGDVTELNEAEGTLTLQTQDGQQLEIHGTPQQLQDYQQGQQANLEYRSFEGTNWIANPPAGAGDGEQVEGRVADVSAAEGSITIEGAQPSDFRAHPENLSDIQPGQQVSITYESKQDKNWVSQIQQQGQQGEQQQMGGSQQEAQEQGGY